jgi:cobalt-zinc-cadmium resistance protein CzcA
VRGRDLGSTVAEAQALIAKNVKLPTGYRILWSGEFEDLENAKARLAVIVPITFLLIMVLLYALFNSLRDSLLSIAGIPFAVAGGILALYFSGQPFSVSAAIGFISLLGVSVMDGILNITYYRELRTHGMAVAEAVFRGAEQRMRPVVDDSTFRRCRPIASGTVAWHRKSGAAAARHGRRRRHDNRPSYAVDRCTCTPHVVPQRRR